MQVNRIFIKTLGALMAVAMLLATLPAGEVMAANITVCASGCDHTTIQAAVTAASAGDTIIVRAGTYVENVVVDKQLSFIGAGSGTGNTVVTSPSPLPDTKVGVFQITGSGTSGSPILLKDIRVEPVGQAGISIGRFTEATGQTVEYLALDNVHVIGSLYNPGTEQERGFYVDLTSTVDHLSIVDSKFSLLTYGWYLQKQVSADTSTVSNVLVLNTTFDYNVHKGIYAEKLTNAVFETCVFDNNGSDDTVLPSYFSSWKAGIDINLKAGIYSNITFDNCVVTDNGTGDAKEGVGLAIKARNDATSYNTYPASLNSVQILGGTYTGNERGIRIGEPGKVNDSITNVVIEGAKIYGNVQKYTGTDGSAYGDLVNLSPAQADASPNWWGQASGPAEGQIFGEVDYTPWCGDAACSSTVPTAVVWVDDGLVCDNNLPCFASIQEGINAVTSGGTVNVLAGTYNEYVGIGKAVNLVGPNAGTHGNATRVDEAVIVGQNTTWLALYVASENVSIDGFKFNGGALDPGGYYTVGVYGRRGNFTLQNSIFTDVEGMSIFTSGGSYGTGYISGVLVKDNLITNPVPTDDPYNFGIYLQSTMATVTGNVVENMRSGIQVQPYNNPGYGLVENNSFSAYGRPLWFNYAVHADSNWEFKNNTVTGIATPAGVEERPFDGIRVETFYLGNVNFTGNTINIGDADSSEIYMLRKVNERGGVIDLEATLANNTWEKVVVIRDGDGEIREDIDIQPSYTRTDATFYSSIQEAIDAASPGDTIEVGPGTYSEGIIIDKLLTIRSTKGAAETIIDTPIGSLTTGVLLARNLGAGTVVFDGFTVRNFSENGIVQPSGVEGAVATTFHVLNNIIIPANGYLRNGIQVVGEGSIVQGNTIYGAPLTAAWSSSAILVIDGNNGTGGTGILVDNNTIIGGGLGVDIGISILTYYSGVSDITVTNNHITDAKNGIRLDGNATTKTISNVTIESNVIDTANRAINSQFVTLSGITAEFNQFLNIATEVLRISPTSALGSMDASPNWFGSIAGPAEGQIVGDVTYIPWCGDAECSFLVAGGEIYGTIVLDQPLRILLLDGTKIYGDGPCFDIQVDNVHIETESNLGAVCYPGSPGIQVYDGATNIVIEGLEIDGQGTAVGNGIDFLGAVTDVAIRDMYIHGMLGDGIHFAAQPAGYVEIKGNLFMGNTGVGVNNPAGTADIDAKWNAWGDYAGPTGTNGDGVGANVLSEPWTHVDVYLEWVATFPRYQDEIALVDETITYGVRANLQNAFSAQFTLTFDPVYLAVDGTPVLGSVFTTPAIGGTVITVGDGTITFNGASAAGNKTGEDLVLFTVTFTGVDTTGDLNPLAYDGISLFAMFPGYGSSLNIYPVELLGIEDVNVYDLPTLAIDPLATYAVGNAKEFTLTVTNPATGRAYTNLNVDLAVPSGAVLEYWDGSAWVTYVDGVDIGTLAVNATADVLFRITFAEAGAAVPVTAKLYDDTIFLVEETFNFEVLGAFSVTGSVQMQGRTIRSGVMVELFHQTLVEYAYDMLSTSPITGNFSFANIAQGVYNLFFTQDRYLNLGVTLNVVENILNWGRLELKGGDLNNNNEVGLGDASIVGANYGATGDNIGDANFDEKVNIFDLAMVGGNYGLQSHTPGGANFAYPDFAVDALSLLP